ncbi:MAG: SDR family NAD(P)-dependent oxidoreductase [Dehalococcoidia bacterium]|nr:MAG: SDR family NAD(P)-dependent oxidoreductase [Dehalococcoidia bacterium]
MGALDGKVAVITGAGRGLGRSHALLMAEEGAKIVVNDLGGEWDGTGKATGPADDVVKEIKDAGGQAVASFDSVTDFQGAKRIIDCAIDNFGKLDILVNNAGFLRDKMTFNMTEEEWDAVIAVHLKGTFNCGRWACAYFREQSKAGKLQSGRIINTMSHAGLLGNVGQGNYASAKLGIGALTMVLAREMEKYNVTCNAIVPMARTRMTVQTPSLSAMFAEKPEGQFDDMAPENVSPLVAYLASDHAQNITGRWLSIRGGKLESWLPPQLAKSIDIDKRWTVKEITERVGELGDLSMPSAGI